MSIDRNKLPDFSETTCMRDDGRRESRTVRARDEGIN